MENKIDATITDEMVNEEIEKKAEEEEMSFVDKLYEERRNGYVVFYNGEDIVRCKLENFVKQPSEGILYDLNRDFAVTTTLMKAKDCENLPKARLLNDFAAATVIEYLRNQLEKLQEPKKNGGE